MTGIFHYPWRFSFFIQGRICSGLPEPTVSPGSPPSVSPEVGAFVWDEAEKKEKKPLEIPGPSLVQGSGQRWYNIPKFGRIDYDSAFVHQFQANGSAANRDFHYALTDTLIWICAALYQKCREQNHDPFADRPLADVCVDFVEYLGSEHDFAPESLIIEIARETVPRLAEIIRRPRMALRRRHENIPLDRIQELDTEVLLNYAHRPGRTTAMKAGPRQRLLGVVRSETADTYENRAVLDFIRRAGRAAQHYCLGMCGRCPYSKACIHDPASVECRSNRVKLAARFERMCAIWENAASISEVARLQKPCVRPNYALQQNARYVFVWRYYQKLLRQEDIEADVWRWKRRSFTDAIRMFMMALWELHLAPKSVLRTSRKPFMVKETNDRGAWLVSDPFEDSLVFLNGSVYTTLYLLNPTEAAELLRAEDDLWYLNADFFWIAIPANNSLRPRICPVWCICRDKMWENEFWKYADTACKEMRTLCLAFGQKHQEFDCSRGWILSECDETGPVAKYGEDGAERNDFQFWGLNLFLSECDFEKKTAGFVSFLERMVK